VGVVEQQEASCCYASGQRVARFPHDEENGRDCESAQRRWHCAVRDIGDLVGDVRIANVLEQEVSFVAN
jgi:hypothetical protein